MLSHSPEQENIMASYIVRFDAIEQSDCQLVQVDAKDAEEARDKAVEFALENYQVIGAVSSVTPA